MTKDILGIEIVEDADRRQYHIGLSPEDVAPTVLLVGDPERVTIVKQFLTDIRVELTNREFFTVTGKYEGYPVSVMSTGIGPSNTEISVIELARIVPPDQLVLLRMGSSGATKKHIKIGQLVISTGAVRLEDTSLAYVDNSYPSVADHEVVSALIYSASQLKEKFHVGLTASSSGFYAQGRSIPNFPIKNPDLSEQLADRNVLNFEMESSTLFTLASIAGIRAGTVCVVFGNRETGKFIQANKKMAAEEAVIKCGLGAVVALSQMDQIKKKNKQQFWHAGLALTE